MDGIENRWFYAKNILKVNSERTQKEKGDPFLLGLLMGNNTGMLTPPSFGLSEIVFRLTSLGSVIPKDY